MSGRSTTTVIHLAVICKGVLAHWKSAKESVLHKTTAATALTGTRTVANVTSRKMTKFFQEPKEFSITSVKVNVVTILFIFQFQTSAF